MKKTIVTLSLLLSFFQHYGQQVLFSQDFNSLPSHVITGWNTSIYSGKTPWGAGPLYTINNDCLGAPLYERIAGICDCTGTGSTKGGGGPNGNVFMFTPKIDLTGINNAWLQFDSYFRKASSSGKTEKATIEISTNGGTNWTILKDLPANANIKEAEVFHIDLTAYSNNSDIRIGFRYNDDGLNEAGWAVDNVTVYVPPDTDLALLYVTPIDSMLRYVEIGHDISYGGRVYNAGLDTVFSYIVHYRQAGKAIKSDTISGIVLPPFTKHSFLHKVPDTAFSSTKASVSVWLEVQGDVIHDNDTLSIDIRGANFIPKKRLVIEEGTGTWCAYCPQGWVYMNQVRDSAWDMSLVSVHSGDLDPMKLNGYDDYLSNLNWNYVPYFLVDRKRRVDPDSFFYVLNRQKNYFGFADIDFDYANYGNELIINAHVKPAIDLEGDFRLVMIMTEDDIHGTGTEWEQLNRYAGGVAGPMGGFENKPYHVPASDMHYNFVARAIAPSPDGTKGLLPGKLLQGKDYTHSIKTILDSSWNKGRMRLIVMLIQNYDTTILNSKQSLFYLNIPNTSMPSPDIVIYPNPANDLAYIQVTSPVQDEIQWFMSDISGKTLYGNNVRAMANQTTRVSLPTSSLPPGLYFVTLQAKAYKKTLKINVIH